MYSQQPYQGQQMPPMTQEQMFAMMNQFCQMWNAMMQGGGSGNQPQGGNQNLFGGQQPKFKQPKPGDITVTFSSSTGQEFNLSCSPNITVGQLIKEFLDVQGLAIPIEKLGDFKMLFTYNAQNLAKKASKNIKDIGISSGSKVSVTDYSNLIGG